MISLESNTINDITYNKYEKNPVILSRFYVTNFFANFLKFHHFHNNSSSKSTIGSALLHNKIFDWSKIKTFADNKVKQVRVMLLNSLPHDKILDWSKLKAFADNKKKL